MRKQYKLRIFDFLNCLSDILDWISPVLNDHHKQVALISLRIADAIDMSVIDQNEVVCAGILHDIGAISLAERMDSMKFESTTGQIHAEMGYYLIKIFEPMKKAAEIIRFHHVPWDEGNGRFHNGWMVPSGSRILFLADHIALLINKKKEILGQIEYIKKKIVDETNRMFEPFLVDAFLTLADKEYFWLDLVSPLIGKQLEQSVKLESIYLNDKELLSFSSLIRRMIDFRSPFTATHSSGVSATAEFLGVLAGLNESECFELKVAGYLHDLGKLAIPAEILEKPGKLTTEEFNVMRGHTFYTYRVLESIEDLAHINKYGSYHHERLDGTGYPFRLKRNDLPLGSRLLAVADVFTALTEDRPYRNGMSNEQTILILKKMAENNKLDSEVVSIVEKHHDEINKVRKAAQEASREEYQKFLTELGDS
ncbi:MAG: HD domain-containing protein [Candidatus Rifleibacteriota bacterium]